MSRYELGTREVEPSPAYAGVLIREYIRRAIVRSGGTVSEAIDSELQEISAAFGNFNRRLEQLERRTPCG